MLPPSSAPPPRRSNAGTLSREFMDVLSAVGRDGKLSGLRRDSY
jgi:hypothetical protein